MTAIHDGDAPARRGPVDDAIKRMRAAAAADGRDDGPGAAGTADPEVLRTVLATLPHDDQRLLWDRHVLGRELAAIATDLGMHARGVLRRLRQAEERLAAAFAAAHARACPPGCLDTRQSLHSYVRHRLSPPRRTALEAHLFGCRGCMRAFIDVREAGWAVRDAGPLLLAGTVAGGAAPVLMGALGAGTAGAGALGWWGPVGAALLAAGEWVRALALQAGQLGKGWLIGAGTVAGVAVAAAAVALGGSGGGPVAAPPAPAPTSSAAAPAPGDATPPEAPSEPGPSETTSPAASPSPDPSEGQPTGTPAPSTPAPSDGGDPTTPDPASPDPSTPEPTTQEPGTTTPDPGTTVSPDPSSPSSPRPTSPSATPRPTSSGSPSPTRSPSPSPSEPSPTPTPTPTEPVQSTVTVDVPGLRGVFEVTADDPDAEVLGVTAGNSWIRARECDDGWYVASNRYRKATVSVVVEAPPSVEEPGVTLTRTNIWPGWLKTC
ncbi:zf-HC2 domain-containing protein [Promicromonospora sp. Marseille-Q5078]